MLYPLPVAMRGRRPHLIQCLASPPQIGRRSVQPFLHSRSRDKHTCWLTDAIHGVTVPDCSGCGLIIAHAPNENVSCSCIYAVFAESTVPIGQLSIILSPVIVRLHRSLSWIQMSRLWDAYNFILASFVSRADLFRWFIATIQPSRPVSMKLNLSCVSWIHE